MFWAKSFLNPPKSNGFGNICIGNKGIGWIKGDVNRSIGVAGVPSLLTAKVPLNAEDNVSFALIFRIAIHPNDGPCVGYSHYAEILLMIVKRILGCSVVVPPVVANEILKLPVDTLVTLSIIRSVPEF